MAFPKHALFLLLLAPTMLALASAATGPVQCPKGAGPVSLPLDLTELWTFFYLGEFNYAQAANAADCRDQAVAAQCQGFTSEFFLFSEKGFKDSRRIFLGNCAFGGPCIELKNGASDATVGEVPTAICQGEPLPLATPQEPEFLSCPKTLESQKLELDISKFAEHADHLVTMVDAWDAEECRKIAEQERCAGQLTGFFVYNELGFKDGAGLELGKCALSAACFSLQKGSTPVTVGSVQPDCRVVPDADTKKAISSVSLRGELSS